MERPPVSSTRVRVKVCGITRRADAETLEAMGVDYLGFNFFAGSRRFLDPEAAAGIISHLKRAVPVGVFVDANAAHIAEVAAATGIRFVQLHGNEGWDLLDALAMPAIKAIPHHRLHDLGGLLSGWENHKARPGYFLVDTADAGFGGSGKAFDWSLLRNHPLPRPFFLAGGLGPENLAEAVKTSRPFAVDLNSQVETAPGIKDSDKVRQCL